MFEVTVLFCYNFNTLENRFESCRYNVVTPGTLSDMYLQLHKVLLSKSEGP